MISSRSIIGRCAIACGFSAAGLLPGGCASYAGRPLDSSIVAPDRAALAADAAALRHPRLAPVTIDFTTPLTLDQLAVLAVVANPELRSLREKANVARAQVFEAGLMPDPTIFLGFDHPFATRNMVDAWSVGLGLDTTGLLAAGSRRDGAARAAGQVRFDIAWQEWQVAGQARLLAYRLQFLSRAADIAADDAARAAVATARVAPAVARGDLAGTLLQAVQEAEAGAQERRAALVHQAASARAELNRLLGLAPDEVLALAPPPPVAPGHLDTDALAQRAIAARLDLIALARGYESQEAAVRGAILEQYPRLSISLNRARDTSAVSTFGPSVSLELPLWNRHRGAIAVAQADRDQLHAEYAARLLATRADVAALVEDIAYSTMEQERLGRRVPELERLARQQQSAAVRGDATTLDAVSAASTLAQASLALLAQQRAVAESVVGLELAVGEPLGGDR